MLGLRPAGFGAGVVCASAVVSIYGVVGVIVDVGVIRARFCEIVGIAIRGVAAIVDTVGILICGVIDCAGIAIRVCACVVCGCNRIILSCRQYRNNRRRRDRSDVLHG